MEISRPDFGKTQKMYPLSNGTKIFKKSYYLQKGPCVLRYVLLQRYHQSTESGSSLQHTPGNVVSEHHCITRQIQDVQNTLLSRKLQGKRATAQTMILENFMRPSS